MAAAKVLDVANFAQLEARRFRRWRITAVFGIAMALGSTMAIAADLVTFVPIPTWSLSAGALLGMVLTALAGMRLLALQVAPKEESVAQTEQLEVARPRGKPRITMWAELSRAFEVLHRGKIPVLTLPVKANEDECTVIELGNKAFQTLEKRNEEVRTAIDDLRKEINTFYIYLTGSQVGLVGARSVAEQLEEFEKKLRRIQSSL